MLGSAAQGSRSVLTGARSIDVVFALVVLALASCATTVPPPPREIDGSANGSRITLAPGQALKVAVDANPATGYRWVIGRGAAALLQPVGAPLYTPISTSAPLVGAGGTMTFEFSAVATGRDTLQLVYRRPAERASAAVREFSVEVVVQ